VGRQIAALGHVHGGRNAKDGEQTSQNKGPFPILEQGGGFQLLFPSNEIRLNGNETIPHAKGKPCGYIFAPQGAQHVVYGGTDSSIHDVWWTPNGWFHSNASAAAEAEPASSDPHGYPLDDQHLHCIAYLADKKLLELSWSQVDSLGPDADEDVATTWRVETLFEASSDALKPTGRPFGGMFSPKRGVVYRAAMGVFGQRSKGRRPEPGTSFSSMQVAFQPPRAIRPGFS